MYVKFTILISFSACRRRESPEEEKNMNIDCESTTVAVVMWSGTNVDHMIPIEDYCSHIPL